MSQLKNLFRKSKILAVSVFTLFGIAVGQLISAKVMFSSNVIGDSMNPTYLNDQRVWVNRLESPERGDIIIVNEGEKYVIKRCVGMPGETIQIIDGVVYINGNEYNEDYIKDGNRDYYSGVASEPVKLADDEYFMLGDNRVISKDSRVIGPVSADMVIGVVITEGNIE